MESAGGTASLRKAAAHWSLAGDKQLLDLLENFHERILTKCQEASSGLDEMVKSLDSASISLQNVNNRFMALSNSKFIESRVYDDDTEITAQEPPIKESPKPPEASTELGRLRESLRVLESYHDTVHILDSDSDTASDDEEERMVLKPKDLYAERPLPYIIGSQQWRSKWHAGLVVEASDSDSGASKRSHQSEQYSESEPEADTQTDKPHASQRTISSTSSMASELTIPPAGKPTDIASELARRLGGNMPQMPEPEPDSPPKGPRPGTVYRPQQPTMATIFPDEPPPLDSCQSERWSQSESDSEDVFAELHRRPPASRDASYAYGNRGVFGEAMVRQPNPPVKTSSPLFVEPQESELFAEKTKSESQPDSVETPPESLFKKPVGGISLFGNNKGAESIGAAILKRHQRKDSTSDEEIPRPPISKTVASTESSQEVRAKTDDKSKDKIQKDIINDLFAKSNKNNQPNKKVVKSTEKVEKPENKKVDLFTDDLFDDIDDIFTNVKPSVKETKGTVKKSLFDDDEDDLFANVAVSKNKVDSKAESKSKSIFDSDDDLFGEQNEENNKKKKNNVIAPDRASASTVTNRSDESKSVSKDVVKTVQPTKSDNIVTIHEKPATDWKSEYKDNIPSASVKTTHTEVKNVQDNSLVTGSKVKGIFDSDSDDDIFSDLKSSNDKIINNQKSINDMIDKKEKKEDPQSTLNDDEDALFLPQEPTSKIEQSSSKVGFDIPANKNTNPMLDIENEELGEDDSLFKQIKSSTHQINTEDKNEFDVDEFEDNTKTENKVLTTSIEDSPKVDTMTTSENKIFSSLVENDNRIQNKKLPNTQFQSPAIFDENDDLDDIFSKTPENDRATEISDKLETTNPNLIQPSKLTNNDKTTSIGDSTNLNSKDLNENQIEESINTEANLVSKENLNENSVIESDIIEDPALENKTLIQSSQQKDEFKGTEIGVKVINTPVLAHDDDIKEELFTTNIERETKNEDNTEYFIEQESLYPGTNEFVSEEPDTLSDIDIFSDVPPEFEKPKEPKKSKNVNALFDDDSDDEALFFKKNDLMTDEKPDVTFSPQEDRLFHIFHDEPPAIDVDFTQKPKKASSLNLASPPSDTYSDFESKTVTEEKKKDPITNVTDQELENVIDEAKKPVGKLKPMNFNINVSTLLPGASPKKVKNYEEVDGQIISTKTTEDFATDSDSRMVKSVSFEGDPDSEVLDNKLSKERAKIQVKRRPSSRRARKEAVRKSGIDFGDDSTDNSSSTDISRKDNLTEKYDSLQANTISDPQNDLLPTHTNTEEKQDVIKDELINNEAKIVDKFTKDVENLTTGPKSNIAEEHHKCLKEKDTYLINTASSSIEQNQMKVSQNTVSSKTKTELQENNDLSTGFSKRPNVKSKVVYILNDEDIFTDTKPTTNVLENKDKVIENTQNTTKNKVLSILSDDDDDLFMSSTSKTSNITTIGNVYKDIASKDKQIDNFDSDEDIFKASQSKPAKDNIKDNNRTTDNKEVIDKMEAKIDKLFVKSQSTKAKSSLFDDLSDDESELFGNKKSVKKSKENDGMSDFIKKDVKLLKNDVKKPLFGDDSDDDDLFGVKTSKREPFQPVSKAAEVASTPREPVFEDPLSMLGQEDDV